VPALNEPKGTAVRRQHHNSCGDGRLGRQRSERHPCGTDPLATAFQSAAAALRYCLLHFHFRHIGGANMAGRNAFCGNKSGTIQITTPFLCLGILLLLSPGPALAQTKPERQSKAARSAERPRSPPNLHRPKSPTEDESTRPEDKLFKGMKYRLIGPFRGGRSLTAAESPAIPPPITSAPPAAESGSPPTAPSVGRQSSTKRELVPSAAWPSPTPIHNIIYVGTGEAASAATFLKAMESTNSFDAGKSWKHIGLSDTRAIGKVIINPITPTSFRSRPRPSLWTNTERGIFRTTDGGKTWEKVLYKDENTGGIDVAFDPHNPTSCSPPVASAPHFVESHRRRPRQRTLPLERRRHNLEASRRARPAQRSLRTHRHRRRGPTLIASTRSWKLAIRWRPLSLDDGGETGTSSIPVTACGSARGITSHLRRPNQRERRLRHDVESFNPPTAAICQQSKSPARR